MKGGKRCTFLNKGDRILPSKFRPIPLVCCVGELIEKMIFTHVYNQVPQRQLPVDIDSILFGITKKL